MKLNSNLRSFLLAAGSSLLAVSSASAQNTNGTWLGNGSAWNLGAAWSGGTIADGIGFAANFTGVDITGDVSMALGANRTIGNIIFTDDTTSSNNLALTGNILTLDVSSGSPNINVTQSDRTLTISSQISGGDGLTKAGSGTLTLSAANTYTGTTTVNAGELRWGINNALGAGNLTVNSGGTVNMQNFTDTVGTITLNRGVINVTTGFPLTGSLKTGSGGFITTGGTVNNWPGIGLGGSFAYNTDSGNETTASIQGIDFNGAGRTFTIADGVQAIDVDITVSLFSAAAGDRNFIKAGAGTMRISGGTFENYNLGSGTTSIEDGTLLLNKSADKNAVGGTGLVTVGNGTGSANSAVLRYVGGNNQIVSNNITIKSDGLFDLVDKTDTVGTVTLEGGSIASTTGVLTSTAAYAFQSGSASAILAGSVGLNKTTAGTVTLSGANTYNGATAISAGTLSASSIVVASSSSNLGNATSAVTLGSAGEQGTLSYTGNSAAYTRGFTIGGAGGGRLDVTTSGQTLTVGTGAVTGSGLFTVGGAGNTTITSNLTHTGGLTKEGAGTLTISGIGNNYAGATNVNVGTLIVNGNISTSSVTVASGATLSGTGTVGALNVLGGGFVAPGNSPGTLEVVGNYSQVGLYTADINGLDPGDLATNHDQISVTGTVNIAGGSLTTLFSTFIPVNADLIFILHNDSTDAITGTYSGLAQGGTVTTYGGFTWKISYNADYATDTFTGTAGGNDIALMAIPEPNVAALLGGLGTLLLLRRRR